MLNQRVITVINNMLNTKILYDELVKIEDSNAIAIQALKNNTYTMQEVIALFG